MIEILSIGHSTLSYAELLARLQRAGVTAIADVRSTPYSRIFPQFSRETLRAALTADEIAYVFLGKELGGRPNDRKCYTGGIADYEKMAHSPNFSNGLDRLEQGARQYRIAMMCSERNPLDCHRCLLVGRALVARGHGVRHLIDEAGLTQGEIEATLLSLADKAEDDMFASRAERLDDAYRSRARKVAYAAASPEPGVNMVAD